tara:strand:+ start:34 stop:276 length:243 start_codon:yes stop_codon:yes gene_type:complete
VVVSVVKHHQLVQQPLEKVVMAAQVAEAEVVTPLMTEMAYQDKDLTEAHLALQLKAEAVVLANKVVLAEINLALVVEEKI